MAELRFPVDGKDLTLADTLNLLDNTESSVREKGAKALGRVFGENIETFSLITNTLAKDKEIEDKWRGYPRPVSERNLSNKVEDEVVEALVGTIRDAYGDLSHRYYRDEGEVVRPGPARLLGPQRAAAGTGRPDAMPGTRAGGSCSAPSTRFDPRIAAIAGRFFDNGWIDAAPRPGKDSGAFCHPTVPSVHPYVLLNFYGRPRDVTTLAHELGHGVHQVLAAEQGTLLSDTPLTLAETASVFGEMLVFRALLDGPGRSRAAAEAAGQQGRGHAQHRGPANGLPRVRAARSPGTARRRAVVPAPRRDLARRPDREPGAGAPFRRRPTGTTGPISRTSSIRRFTCTPTLSAIAS